MSILTVLMSEPPFKESEDGTTIIGNRKLRRRLANMRMGKDKRSEGRKGVGIKIQNAVWKTKCNST